MIAQGASVLCDGHTQVQETLVVLRGQELHIYSFVAGVQDTQQIPSSYQMVPGNPALQPCPKLLCLSRPVPFWGGGGGGAGFHVLKAGLELLECLYFPRAGITGELHDSSSVLHRAPQVLKTSTQTVQTAQTYHPSTWEAVARSGQS